MKKKLIALAVILIMTLTFGLVACKTDLSGLDTKLDELKTQITQLQAKVNDLESKVNGAAKPSDLASLSTELANVTASLNALQTDVTGLKTENAALKALVSSLQTRLGEVQFNLANVGYAYNGFAAQVTFGGASHSGLAFVNVDVGSRIVFDEALIPNEWAKLSYVAGAAATNAVGTEGQDGYAAAKPAVEATGSIFTLGATKKVSDPANAATDNTELDSLGQYVYKYIGRSNAVTYYPRFIEITLRGKTTLYEGKTVVLNQTTGEYTAPTTEEYQATWCFRYFKVTELEVAEEEGVNVIKKCVADISLDNSFEGTLNNYLTAEAYIAALNGIETTSNHGAAAAPANFVKYINGFGVGATLAACTPVRVDVERSRWTVDAAKKQLNVTVTDNTIPFGASISGISTALSGFTSSAWNDNNNLAYATTFFKLGSSYSGHFYFDGKTFDNAAGIAYSEMFNKLLPIAKAVVFNGWTVSGQNAQVGHVQTVNVTGTGAPATISTGASAYNTAVYLNLIVTAIKRAQGVIPGVVAVTGVTITGAATADLDWDATVQLDVSFTPANPTEQGVTWTSSAPAVATVSATGLVTAVSEGTAIITATSDSDGTKFDTRTVTVAAETALHGARRLINALPAADAVVADSATAIEEARAAFEALGTQKAALAIDGNNTTAVYKKLEAAENALISVLYPNGDDYLHVAGVASQKAGTQAFTQTACDITLVVDKTSQEIVAVIFTYVDGTTGTTTGGNYITRFFFGRTGQNPSQENTLSEMIVQIVGQNISVFKAMTPGNSAAAIGNITAVRSGASYSRGTMLNSVIDAAKKADAILNPTE